MTHTARNTTIEKNRTALMRLVTAWLFIASFFNAKPDRLLPRRVGLWIAGLVSKAEQATHYLYIAVGYQSANFSNIPFDSPASITIGEAIARLKAIKKALVNLRIYTNTQPNHDMPKRRLHARTIFALHQKFQDQNFASRAPPKFWQNCIAAPIALLMKRDNAGSYADHSGHPRL